MRIKTITLLFTFFNFLNLYCQEFQPSHCEPIFNSNAFSFESSDLENLDPNLSFLIDENYKVDFDTLNVIDGSRSLRVDGLKENVKTYATISLKIPLKVKTAATIELSLWVKTESLRGENAAAIVRLMGNNNIKGATPSIFEFSKRSLKDTEDWTLLTLSTILKDDVNYIILSGLMQGKGSAWFDNFTLKINGEEINDVLFFENSTEAAKTKKVLSAYVTPLDLNTLEIIGTSISNNNPNTRIIGLGEATHGTKEIYKFKIEIIKSLIKKHQVSEIALEAYYANTAELNKYIITGKGDLKTLITELGFWPYYTKEFFDFMIWLKEYNKHVADKISITGVDSQSGGNSLKVLTEKLKDDAYTSKLLKQLKNDTTQITQKIKISDLVFKELVKAKKDENLLNNARILKNSYYLDQFNGLKYSRIRDSLVASNIELLEEQLPLGHKMIFWAHDLHIQKKEGWTGGYLNEKFGEDYMNLGFLLGNGKFTAIDKQSRKLDSDNILSSIKCNSLEAVIDGYNHPIVLIENKYASNNPYLKNNFFDKYLEKRSIGALDTNEQFTLLGDNAGNLFDLLIYIKNSNPSELLN